MEVVETWRGLAEALRGATVALGNFDGVHRGHAHLLRAAHGARPGAKLAVLTFEPHPRQLFRAEDPPFRLTLATERAAALAELGVQVLYQIPFDRAFADLSAASFVEEVLHAGVGAAHLACGADFAFGHRRGGDVGYLAERAEALGIGLTVVPKLADAQGPISSTRIRRLLQDGYPERAASDLGRTWTVRGVVAHGDQRGRTIGYPTANVPLGSHLEPARGVYAVRVRLADGSERAGGGECRAAADGGRGAREPGGGAPVRLGGRPLRAGGGSGAALVPARRAEVRVVRRVAGADRGGCVAGAGDARDGGVTERPHRIVVAGGGAAGLELVTKLGNRYGRKRMAEVTLVERGRTHLWKPLLHSVAAGSLSEPDQELDYLAQAHWHGFTYRYGPAVGLDRDGKLLLLGATYDDDGREITPTTSVRYDTLVVAIGSVTNDFGTPGVAAFAVPLESAPQAARFHRRLLNACLRANAQDEPIRPGQLHVAIIGAGATGAELGAQLHGTVRAIVAYGLDRIEPARDVRIVLIEAAPRILPALPERIAAAAYAELRKLDIGIRTDSRVAAVRADGVVLAGGEVIPAELVVWAAGVKAPDVLAEFGGLEVTRQNQLVVLPTLQTTRDADVFAIGDCAACPRRDGKGTVPPRAQAAHQQASHMVRQIERRFAGQELVPFRYRDFGSLVSLGEYSTIGSLMGAIGGRSLFVEGAFAKFMYWSLYKMHLAALHGVVRTAWRTVLGVVSDRPVARVKLH